MNYGEIENAPGLRIKRLSQETGIVAARDGYTFGDGDFPLGSLLRIRPYHVRTSLSQGDFASTPRAPGVAHPSPATRPILSLQACAVGAMHPVYYVVEGETVIDTWYALRDSAPAPMSRPPCPGRLLIVEPCTAGALFVGGRRSSPPDLGTGSSTLGTLDERPGRGGGVSSNRFSSGAQANIGRQT